MDLEALKDFKLEKPDHSETAAIEVRRGDVVYIHAGQENRIGAEQRGDHPVLVVGNDAGNKNSSTIEIVFITSSETKSSLPTHVPIRTPSCYGIALCEHIYTISKERIYSRAGYLNPIKMEEIDLALLISLGMNRYKNQVTAPIEVEKEQAVPQALMSDKLLLSDTYIEVISAANVYIEKIVDLGDKIIDMTKVWTEDSPLKISVNNGLENNLSKETIDGLQRTINDALSRQKDFFVSELKKLIGMENLITSGETSIVEEEITITEEIINTESIDSKPRAGLPYLEKEAIKKESIKEEPPKEESKDEMFLHKDFTVSDLRQWVKEKKNLKEMSVLMGVPYGSVSYYLKKAGISIKRDLSITEQRMIENAMDKSEFRENMVNRRSF